MTYKNTMKKLTKSAPELLGLIKLHANIAIVTISVTNRGGIRTVVN